MKKALIALVSLAVILSASEIEIGTGGAKATYPLFGC